MIYLIITAKAIAADINKREALKKKIRR